MGTARPSDRMEVAGELSERGPFRNGGLSIPRDVENSAEDCLEVAPPQRRTETRVGQSGLPGPQTELSATTHVFGGPRADEVHRDLLRPTTLNSGVDFSERVISALADVVDEMLQIKYGWALDSADFVEKVLGLCDTYASISVKRIAKLINMRNDLWFRSRFRDPGREKVFRLSLKCDELEGFTEVRRRLRLLPGTASVVVVLSNGGGTQSEFVTSAGSVDAVAAFRTTAADVGCAVGRTCGTSVRQLIRQFSSTDMCLAVAIEPSIVSVCARGTGFNGRDVYEPPPPATREFEGLQELLEEGPNTRPRSAGSRAPAAHRVPRELVTSLHATVPTTTVLRQMGAALDLHDIEPEGILEIYQKLATWLRGEPHEAQTKSALRDAAIHRLIVTAMHRCDSHRDACESSCRVIGWASRQHVENAVAFVNSGGITQICKAMEAHHGDKDLQRHGLYALGCLVYYGGGAAKAASSGVIKLAMRAIGVHRTSPSVHINACEVLRSLAESGEAPMDELAQVAQGAKRAFPHDPTVHRAADMLLKLVVPRTAANVGALMDTSASDEAIQRSGICSLGQLAAHGGVAWCGAASGAVSRILRAMSVHAGSADTQAVGLWALGRLAERVEAPWAGMHDAAERARSRHPSSALVRRHAEELLAYLLRTVA